MKPEYEQMELDTRPALTRAIVAVTNDTVKTVGEMIQQNYELMVANGSLAPGFVRNRHEAYGVAAEQMVKISDAVKVIKKDIDGLLGTLAEPNKSAVEATSDIYNSALTGAVVLVQAAAEMKRTMEQLYVSESTEPRKTPLEELASGDFEEAEALDTADNGGESEE